VNLVGTRSYDEVIERVRARAAETPPGEWVSGRGWDQNDWPEQQFPALGAIPTVQCTCGASTGTQRRQRAGARAAGVGRHPIRPADGSSAGRMTPAGVLVIVASVWPHPGTIGRRRRACSSPGHCAPWADWRHDAGRRVTREARACSLPVTSGCASMPCGARRNDAGGTGTALEPGRSSTTHLAARTVKLVADALGSRSAALLEP
jgi:hypothetical protein